VIPLGGFLFGFDTGEANRGAPWHRRVRGRLGYEVFEHPTVRWLW
jgi:hypothetical protein